MTDQTAQQHAENVQRGIVFSLAAIPVAIVGYAIAGYLAGNSTGTFVGYLVAVVSIIIPNVVVWFYRKGSGGAFSKSARIPFVGISLVAIVVGLVAGIIARAYARFASVGGDGGFFASAFWTAFGKQAFSEDSLIAIVVGLAIGIFALIKVLKTPVEQPSVASPMDAAFAPPSATTPAAPAVTPPPAPSHGVILNGEPLDPNKKR